jgi:hypothetical protein
MQSEEDGRRGLGWDEKEGARWSAPTSGIEARAGCGWDHQAATARPLAGRGLAGVSAYARGRGLLRTQVMARPSTSMAAKRGLLGRCAVHRGARGEWMARRRRDGVLCRPLRGPACSTYRLPRYLLLLLAAHRRATTHCLKPRLSR